MFLRHSILFSLKQGSAFRHIVVGSVCQPVERYRFVVGPRQGASHGVLGVRRLRWLGLRHGLAVPVASVEVGTGYRAFGHSGKRNYLGSLSSSLLGTQLDKQARSV